MPQFDINSNKSLIMIFSILFFVYLLTMSVVFNSALKIVNFFKVINKNNTQFNLFYCLNVIFFKLESENAFKKLNSFLI